VNRFHQREDVEREAERVSNEMVARCAELRVLFGKLLHHGFLAYSRPTDDGWGSLRLSFGRIAPPFDVKVGYDGRDEIFSIR
jgi:hypothetical protein